jgi:hypothetical protein
MTEDRRKQLERVIRRAIEKIPVADRPWNDRLVEPIAQAVLDFEEEDLGQG